MALTEDERTVGKKGIGTPWYAGYAHETRKALIRARVTERAAFNRFKAQRRREECKKKGGRYVGGTCVLDYTPHGLANLTDVHPTVS